MVGSSLVAQPAAQPGDRDSAAEFKGWTDRLASAAKRKDGTDEALSLTTIGRLWPWALPELSGKLVEQAVSDSQRADLGEPRFTLLQMLYVARWKLRDGSEPGNWWLELTRDLIDRNQIDQAIAVAVHINDPYDLIALRVDNRYRRIQGAKLIERDVAKAARQDLERRQAAATQDPRDLSSVTRVLVGLMRLQRYDDVLDLTGSVLARVQNAAPDSPPYRDMSRLPWLLDYRGHTLFALGRYDEAVTVMRRANEESKPDAVSHALNLAIMLARLDRPQEALAALPKIDTASAYGHGVAAYARVMIASELNDESALEAAMADLRELAPTFPQLLEHALVAAGKNDEAAAVLRERLSDPVLRTEALVEIQNYADHPAPDRALQWRAARRALRDRRDVRRLVDEYGRVSSYRLAPYDED
jgi:beta-barrel assembly-enhancing protease